MGKVTLRKALELAVATEKAGAKYYQRMSESFADNRGVAEDFAQLARDESGHETQFAELLNQVPRDKRLSEEDEALLRATVMSEFFDKGGLEDTTDIKTPADALVRAVRFERATLFYYQSLKEVIGESEELDHLIAAEKKHVTSLMQVILSDSKFQGIADPWL
jgi:rubrerythrin